MGHNRRALFASVVGSIIEWYDFYLYGTATGLVFSLLYFPADNPTVSLLLAFASFGVGYLARPLGSILFGHLGDRWGRKAALIYTLVGMGGATVVIGLLPTYAQIGILAPVLLVIARIIQGISLGGTFSLALISRFTTEEQFLAWGWRIPFLLSVVLIVIAIWVRSGIEETPVFQQQKQSGEPGYLSWRRCAKIGETCCA